MEKPLRPSTLPILIITGASGFIGRNLLQKFKSSFYIYALARRSAITSGVELNNNINWIRVDISDNNKIHEVFKTIAVNGGADYIFHLAGFFNFDNKNDPEYERTNVIGTKNILEGARKLYLKRFVFASSITVTSFENSTQTIDENSPTNAKFPYAISKAKAEALVSESSSYFPCTTIRLAAIFSDWCEYKPLYCFLNTWLSKKWHHKMLAGKGEAAVPYLHIRDLSNFFMAVIKNTGHLDQYNILIASPDSATSHKELYKVACGFSYFHSIKPILIPKAVVSIGIVLRMLWGKITRHLPFERLWMMKYIDKKLIVDSSETQKMLSWEPIRRYSINHRLLFIIANMKRNPYEWQYKNEIILDQAITQRKYLDIYEGMTELKDEIINKTFVQFIAVENSKKFPTYQHLECEQLLNRIENIFNMLEFDVCTGNRGNILEYGRSIAEARFAEGFTSNEVINAVQLTADVIVTQLLQQDGLKEMEQLIHDEVTMTLQMVIERIEDTYEQLSLGINK